MVNVWGDSIGTGVIAHLCEKDQSNAENKKLEEINSIERTFPNMNFAFSIDDNTYETAL